MQKVALVSGGSRGIGRACVFALARAGWQVVFLCRSRTDLADDVLQQLRAEGLNAAWYACDVADASQVKQVMQQVLRIYHRVDLLVNNAAIAHIGLLTDMTEQQWDRIFDVNVKGAYHLIQSVLPGMVSRGCGNIINIASMWGEVGASCEVAYSAAKAALIGMTKALAKEVGPSGVRVNCVSPGVIDTDMNAELDDAAKAELADETPLGRMGMPEEVAQAVVYLSGDGASFITGQVLGVSGGLVV